MTLLTSKSFRGAPSGSESLRYWLLGRAGSWSGDWTIEQALDFAREDGAGPSVGIVGWLEQNRHVPQVFCEADLRGVRLQCADLRGVNLRGATLCASDLVGVSLRGVLGVI